MVSILHIREFLCFCLCINIWRGLMYLGFERRWNWIYVFDCLVRGAYRQQRVTLVRA